MISNSEIRRWNAMISMLILALLTGCKSDTKTPIDDEKLVVVNDDSISTQDNDSVQLASYIEKKNNQIKEELGNLDYQQIYSGNILYPKDSTFKVLNFFGEYTGGATYNPYAEHLLLYNNQELTSTMGGEIFRIDNLNEGDYLFYVNNISRLSNYINVYSGSIKGDSLVTHKLNKSDYGNYLFNFIRNRKEDLNLENTRIDLNDWNDHETLSALQLAASEIEPGNYYKVSEEPFLTIEVDDDQAIEPQFIVYYKHTKGVLREKILRIRHKEGRFNDVLLASTFSASIVEISTEFVNDSTFIKTEVSNMFLSKTKNSDQPIWDTLVNQYRYNKLFEFKRIN